MNFKALVITIILSFLSHIAAIAQDFDSTKNNADLAFMDGKYQSALEMYESIMSSTVTDSAKIALVYSNAGMCCTELGKNTDAIKYFNEAVKLKVPQLMIYDQLISLAKDEKDYDSYEFALLQKLKEFPDFEVDIKRKLAFHYYNTKQYKKLLEITSVLTEWYPDNAKFHLFDAVSKQNLEDIDGAEKSYYKALELDPDHAGANMGIGMILYNRASNLYDKMKSDYEKIDKPSRVDYSDYRKQIEQPKQIYSEALTYLLKAYENKSYASLKGIIKNAYLRLEDTANAAKY